MTENIIYYGICVFFSLLGLGGSWYSRHRNYIVKVSALAFTTAFVVYLYMQQHDLFLYLDITHSLSWVNEVSGQGGRLRMAVVTVKFFSVVAYLVCFEHVVIASTKRITSLSNIVTAKKRPPLDAQKAARRL